MPSPLRFSPLLLALLLGIISCKDQEQARATPPERDSSPPIPVPISYSHQIRPLLAQKCFRCHSGDPSRNKSGLRLDLAESATTPRPNEDGTQQPAALIAGNPEKSLLWQRIHSTEGDTVMPPPDHGEPLSTNEKELLTRWIKEGARSEPHWSLQAFSTPSPPTVPKEQAWNEIDQFVVNRLDASGLTPAPLADAQTLLRRVSLALTGLPPDWERISALAQQNLSSDSPEFRELLTSTVSELLNSPAFGEELARPWLNAVPYADTADAKNQFPASHWPYRDWVINSLNANLRIDQFLLAQLAGDDLTEQSAEAIVGTNFLRLSPLTTDDLADPKVERTRLGNERAARIGQAMLGLDLRCAQCHDHPADPLTTSDFASLTSTFQLAGESPVHRPGIVPSPTQGLPSESQKELLLARQLDAHRSGRSLAELTTSDAAAYRTWLQDDFKATFINDPVGIFNFDEKQALVANHALDGTGTGNAKGLLFVPGASGSAVRLTPETSLRFENLLPIRSWTPWTATLRFRVNAQSPALILSHALGAGTHLRGFDLQIDDGYLMARLARDWPGHAIGVRSSQAVVSTGHWHTLSVSYDGSSSAAGLRIFLEGQAVGTETLADSLWKPVLPKEAPTRWILGARPKGLPGGMTGEIDDFQLHRRALTELEIAYLYNGQAFTQALQQPGPAVQRYFFSALHPPARKIQEQLLIARRQSIEPAELIPEVAVMRANSEQSERRSVPALLRLPGDDESQTLLSRHQLARQLTEHPLTARVFVNRVWAHFFGKGLVDLGAGFGLHAPSPSHPGLLEWLAADFVANGWNLKRLCHQILLSRSFLQDSTLRPEVSVRDPGFRLLAQGPSFALDPGSLRDFTLGASQLLEPSRGGPPVSASSNHRSVYLVTLRPQADPQLRSAGSCPLDYNQVPLRPPVSGLPEGVLFAISERLATQALARNANDPAQAAFLQLLGRLPTDTERSSVPTEKTPGAWASYLRAELLSSPLPQR